MREIVCVRAREVPAGNHSARAFLHLQSICLCTRTRAYAVSVVERMLERHGVVITFAIRPVMRVIRGSCLI